jgi:transcriptional regulator with XRE-family HTH domain
MYHLNPEKLKTCRLAKKITLQEAANAAGYKNATAILYAERGIARLPVDRAMALAKLYNVSIEDFFDKEEPPRSADATG